MLKGKLIHPEILAALGSAGHNSKILIADGNYPFATAINPRAKQVFLNLSPGIVSATDALRAVVSAVPIEAAAVMLPDTGDMPPIFAEFSEILPGEIHLEALERASFYAAGRDSNVALLIATGEQRFYANILLTIGSIAP